MLRVSKGSLGNYMWRIAQTAKYFYDFGRTLDILKTLFCHQQFADTMSAKGTIEPWMANLW